MTDRITLGRLRLETTTSMACSVTMLDAAEAAELVGGIAAADVSGEFRFDRDDAAIWPSVQSTDEMPAFLPRGSRRCERECFRAPEELIGSLRTLMVDHRPLEG